MANKIQLRRDSASNWTNSNPTLSQGEIGIELDSEGGPSIKIGDGITAWTDLGYFSSGSGGGSGYGNTQVAAYLANYLPNYTISNATHSTYSDSANSVTWSNVSGKPTFATVATSGSYTDLSNKPFIPTDIANLTDSTGLLSGTYGDSNVASYLTSQSYATQNYVTTQGYITISALSDYATKSYVTNQGYITSAALSGYVTGTPWTNEGYLTSASLTDYALQTDVSNAIANLVASAPSTLETLNELANALGNDASFSTTVTNALANKANANAFGNFTLVGDAITDTSNGNITINTNDNTWTFGTDGGLTLPSGGVLGDTYGDGGVSLKGTSGKYVELSSHDGNSYIWVQDNGYESGPSEAVIEVNSNRWYFHNDGNLTLPNTNKIAKVDNTPVTGQRYAFSANSTGGTPSWNNVTQVTLTKPVGFTSSTWSLHLENGTGITITVDSITDNNNGTITVYWGGNTTGGSNIWPMVLISNDYVPEQQDGGTDIVTESGDWLFRNDGALVGSGNITSGNITTGILNVNQIDLSGNIVPTTDNTYDLGTPSQQFRHIYTANGSIYIGNIKLSNDGGNLSVQQVTNVGQNNESNVAVALKTDRLTNTSGKEAILDNSSDDLILPNGLKFKWVGDSSLKGGVGTGPGGITLYGDTNDEVAISVQPMSGGPKQWIFSPDGSVQFPDNSVQTTAYDYAPMKQMNLEGGFASTIYDIELLYIDCGGSYARGVMANEIYDGSTGGATQTQFDRVLNGGGA